MQPQNWRLRAAKGCAATLWKVCLPRCWRPLYRAVSRHRRCVCAGGSVFTAVDDLTALGLGMSLPWLLIAAFPGIAPLPKPGRWMNGLRLVLGAMMFITALWLISLLIPHTGRKPLP